jgi:hypothetical protein
MKAKPPTNAAMMMNNKNSNGSVAPSGIVLAYPRDGPLFFAGRHYQRLLRLGKRVKKTPDDDAVGTDDIIIPIALSAGSNRSSFSQQEIGHRPQSSSTRWFPEHEFLWEHFKKADV